MKKVAVILSGLLLIVFAINVNGQQSPQMKIDLSGKWFFSRDEAKVGLAEKWYHQKLKTVGDGPSEIILPGSTDEAKAGMQNPQKPNLNGLYRPNIYKILSISLPKVTTDIKSPKLKKKRKNRKDEIN